MPPHSEQIVSRICGALFRGSLVPGPVMATCVRRTRSLATATPHALGPSGATVGSGSGSRVDPVVRLLPRSRCRYGAW
ncbi:hypothetical protein EYC57_22290 [Xanthomonas oryzae]|nr:hypothetical protein EYC57_22290 [Xanthomonas oryzae]